MTAKEGIRNGIRRISIAGFKCFSEETSVDIRPLTLFTGANGTGKSCVMQPLLMLKQSLEACYDPGPLLLNGPHVSFTSASQLLSHTGEADLEKRFSIGLELTGGDYVKNTYRRYKDNPSGFSIEETLYHGSWYQYRLYPDIKAEDFLKQLSEGAGPVRGNSSDFESLEVSRERLFLRLSCRFSRFKTLNIDPAPNFDGVIHNVIHLAVGRGNPERNYPRIGFSDTFVGTFEEYVPSIIAEWQKRKDCDQLQHVNRELASLGLGTAVSAYPLNDTQLEIRIGAMQKELPAPWFDLADAGFGVSQTLPVLVALRVAVPGQVVYLEQPEIYLHPDARGAMGAILVDAANRGVKVVVETHSNILQAAIRDHLENGDLVADDLAVHHFTRTDTGYRIEPMDITSVEA